MKFSSVSKVLALIALAVVSVSMTRHLFGQNGIQKDVLPPAGDPTSHSPHVKGISIETSPSPAVPPEAPEEPDLQQMLGSTGLSGAAGMPDFSVVNLGHGEIGLHAKAWFFERNPRHKFMWVLQVYAEDRTTLVHEHRYTDQTAVIVEQLWKPTFTDTVKLPPATYFVSLSVQIVPGHMDPDTLKTATLRGTGIRADGSGFVTVTN